MFTHLSSLANRLGMILAILFALSAQMSFGTTSLTLDNPKCKCPKTPGDFLEKPQAFNFGRFRGQCIDSCRFRPATLLKQKFYSGVKVKQNELLIGNVLHMEKFYTAIVPIQSINKAAVGFEEFTPGVFHVFLKFELSPDSIPIRLLSQSKPHGPATQTRSLVVSSEGVPPKDHKYSLFESYFGQYLVAHRVTSGEEVDRWTSFLKHEVTYYPLIARPDQASLMLKNALFESDKIQLQNIYQLFTNNCATAAIGFINSGIDALAQKQMPQTIQIDRALPLTGPIGTLRFLRAKQLIPTQHQALLNSSH